MVIVKCNAQHLGFSRPVKEGVRNYRYHLSSRAPDGIGTKATRAIDIYTTLNKEYTRNPLMVLCTTGAHHPAGPANSTSISRGLAGRYLTARLRGKTVNPPATRTGAMTPVEILDMWLPVFCTASSCQKSISTQTGTRRQLHSTYSQTPSKTQTPPTVMTLLQ